VPHFRRPDQFIYTFVRKEAVLSSQIEGTQSSLSDLLLFDPIRRGLRGDWTNDADPGVKNRSIAQLLPQLAFHTIGFSA
jgi:hypothetical protein